MNMNSRAYYLTTFAAWKRHAHRYAQSHWAAADPGGKPAAISDAAPVLALIEADEGTHFALERDTEFEALPPVLAAAPVSPRVAAALAGYGIAPGATMLDATEAVARVHPLLRYRAL